MRIRLYSCWYGSFFLLLVCSSLAVGQLPQQVYNIVTYGAKGDSTTNNAAAIQRALDDCTAHGGGTVLVPSGGIYLTGPIHLRSFVELHVEAGSELRASTDTSLYTQSAFGSNLGEGTVWIGGYRLQQVTLSGGGTLNGNGIAFMGAEEADAYALKPFVVKDPRPHLFTLVGCNKLRIRDLSFTNAAYWTLHLVGCNDVAIADVTILTSTKIRNSDGIDIDHSRNVRISNCYIESGDDAICLKNRREYAAWGPCENITVTNCILTSSSCAFKIGSENVDRISHVLVNNCLIVHSNRGLGIQHRDEGSVNDVVFSNITIESHLFSDVWWGKAEPIYITAFKRAAAKGKDAGLRLPPGKKEGRVGNISDVYFSQIHCTAENGVYVAAESPDKIRNIHFNQVSVLLDKTTSYAGGVVDRRPSNVEGLVSYPSSGFMLDQATGIQLRNCSVSWGSNRPPYFAHALDSRGVLRLDAAGLQGVAAFPAKLPACKVVSR